jgi:hypothetical protein
LRESAGCGVAKTATRPFSKKIFCASIRVEAKKAINKLESPTRKERLHMHDREFPNTTATGEHGTGHGSAESNTHPNEGGAHAPDTTHGGSEHGQQHPEIDNSERTDVMKTTNMTTSTGAALSLALFLILTGGAGTTYGFTPQGAGGGQESPVFCNGGGEFGGQQGGSAQGDEGGGGAGAYVIGQEVTCKTGTAGGEGIQDGQGTEVGTDTDGGDGTPNLGGGLRTGGISWGGTGGDGETGLSGGISGNGGSPGGGGQDGPDGFGF